MGNMIPKRVRKGIAKFNQAKKRAARKPVKTAQPAKPEVKGKK
jgi:hypothetical protein